MATKIVELDGIGEVHITKRRGSRSLRISISPDSTIRVTIPYWTPYQSGLDFARSKTEWVLSHLPAKEPPLQTGHRIGKAHQLVFITAAIDSPSTRIAGTEIRIVRPIGMAATHQTVQKAASRASIRALRTQAEKLLPQRLEQLALRHGFSYNSVRIKQLTGRWGSCDNKQDIVLNLFLMQLPWELIDYVLLHELTHTRHLNHGPDFWQHFLACEPRAKELRKLIGAQKPVLRPVLHTATPQVA